MVLLYIYPRQQQQIFQIFTQSIDAIDVTSVTLSCFKKYQCNSCHKMLIDAI